MLTASAFFAESAFLAKRPPPLPVPSRQPLAFRGDVWHGSLPQLLLIHLLGPRRSFGAVTVTPWTRTIFI